MVCKSYNDFKSAFFRFTGLDLDMYSDPKLSMFNRLKDLLTRYYKTPNADEAFQKAIIEMRINPELTQSIYLKLTIKWSYFFRALDKWDTLMGLVKDGSYSHLKIWSAGCSSGEEPYSLSIFLMEHFPRLSFEIYASDIDPGVISKAKEGSYGKETFTYEKNVDWKLVRKYFSLNCSNKYEVNEDVKKHVYFQTHNLLTPPFQKNFDLIICRNVLIYFNNEAKDIIYSHFSKALKPNGIYFGGSTDQFFNYTDYHFSPLLTNFYIKKE